MNGDLFRNAEREIQRQLEEAFWRTRFGELVRRYGGTGRLGLAEMLGAVREVRELRDLVGPIVREVELVERYSGSAFEGYLREFLKQLGPAGRLLDVIVHGLRRQRRFDTVQIAIELLRAFGFEVLPRPGMPLTDAELRRAVEAAARFLDWASQFAPVPERRPVETVPVAEREIETRRRRAAVGEQVIVPFATGPRQFPADHPLVTGEMVRVESSNVHSIGYDLDTGTLYVRFLVTVVREGRVRQFGGSLYGYRGVTPEEFLRFLDAPSKGGWVWDNLRVRGTASGHKKDYFLAGIVGGYVPRKATLQWITDPKTGKPHLAEVFAPRTVLWRGQYVTSPRPMEVVQVFKVVKPPRPEMRHLVGLS
jgi:hypothetical protein